MKFVGVSGDGGAGFPSWAVTLDGKKLARHSQLREHSQGFSWGYGGSGPAQLALAIMVEYLKAHPEDLQLAAAARGYKCRIPDPTEIDLGSRHQTKLSEEEKIACWVALQTYQRFKANVIARLDRMMPWVLEDRDIHSALLRLAADDATVTDIAEIGQFKGIVTHGKNE